MNLSANSKCPCGSGQKYKKCCEIYHKGVKTPNAPALMKSRYSAYAVCDAMYIIRTTHPNNPDAREDKKIWAKEIEAFCKNEKFMGLEIIEVVDGENEAFVTFKASLSSGAFIEKSRFLKENGIWLYESGIIDLS